MSDREEGLAWQVGVWDRISQIYWSEIDRRFEPVVDSVLVRADLQAGEHVLDVGTGTGALAEKAAVAVEPGGHVLAIDISPEMLTLARARADQAPRGFQVEEGSAEGIPAADASFDVILSSLTLMYVIDRPSAARELARVVRPGGRLVASVWAGPDSCDIVLFQQTAGQFAPPPPVPGVGPGALADPQSFLQDLARAGIDAHVETEVLGFDFDDFASAWDTLAGVTTAMLPLERQQEAQAAVKAAMWPDTDEPRHFDNTTQFVIGLRG